MSPSQQRPRFSFLTTAYRTEDFLAETIDSVITQAGGDWEMVVVDNGNDDAIAAIVERYAAGDPRIKLVRQENRGYSGGVMAAASVARGQYLCVLDSDDQLMPDFVTTLGSFLDSHHDADAVGCDAYQFIDGERDAIDRGYLHSIGVRHPSWRGELLTASEVLGGRVPYYTGAIHRPAWDAVGGYAPGPTDVQEDVLCWLRLTTDFEVYLLPDRLARSRFRENSESHDPVKIEKFEHSLIRTFETFAVESGRPAHLQAVTLQVRRMKYNQAFRRARWAFLDGDISGARRFAREALSNRRTLRAATVVAALTAFPGLLGHVHPVKQRLAVSARRLRHRFSP